MNRIPASVFLLAANTIVAIAIAGCGYKGPLYLPEESPAVESTLESRESSESPDPEKEESDQ